MGKAFKVYLVYSALIELLNNMVFKKYFCMFYSKSKS